MEITYIRIRIEHENKKIKGYADISLDRTIFIDNIKIVEKNNKIDIELPVWFDFFYRDNENGRELDFENLGFAIEREFITKIRTKVKYEYKKQLVLNGREKKRLHWWIDEGMSDNEILYDYRELIDDEINEYRPCNITEEIIKKEIKKYREEKTGQEYDIEKALEEEYTKEEKEIETWLTRRTKS